MTHHTCELARADITLLTILPGAKGAKEHENGCDRESNQEANEEVGLQRDSYHHSLDEEWN